MTEAAERAAVVAEFTALKHDLAASLTGTPVVADIVARALSAGPNFDVVTLSRRQPEHEWTVGQYIARLVSAERIDRGRVLLAEHSDLLGQLAARFGAPPETLVAIWGIESRYGEACGTASVVRSLATLAIADDRRGAFWRGELAALCTLMRDGRLASADLSGSWAGALGQTQFMPSTLAAHGVDFDRDGLCDVLRSPADALASAANYLKASGWPAQKPWGINVAITPDFSWDAWSPDEQKPLSAWLIAGLDVTDPASPLGDDTPLRLIAPEGAEAPLFLVSGAFNALLAYNPAVSYALAVGLLGDAIAGRPGPAQTWRQASAVLGRSDRVTLQKAMSARGHDTGGIDGILGPKSRSAIRACQQSAGLPADGFPTRALLQHLTQGSRI
ncbi:MAG: lytic murein transglycosylase [Pseudomonadota bacterium]